MHISKIFKKEVIEMMTVSEKLKSQIRIVTDATYEEAVWCSGKKVFLILGARWCGDSRNLLENVLPPYVEKYSDQVLFLLVEVELEKMGEVENPRVKTDFGIQTYPTIVIFNNGIFLDEMSPEESREKGSQEKAVKKLLFLLGMK